MHLRFPGLTRPALPAQLRRRLLPGVFSLLVIIMSAAGALLPSRPVSAQGTIPQPPDWLEPRGLSIVDMVGFVPEDQLRDAILVYETGTGLVQYVSGSRAGNSVTINVRMTPRYGPGFTVVGCLAQPAAYDQWPTVVPASTMQIFANGQDVTSLINWQSSIPPPARCFPRRMRAGISAMSARHTCKPAAAPSMSRPTAVARF